MITEHERSENQKVAHLPEPEVMEGKLMALGVPTDKGVIFYRNTGLAGLALRVTKNNARSFTLDYTVNGLQRRYTLAPVSKVVNGKVVKYGTTLAEAIRLATIKRGEIAQGRDPFDIDAEAEAKAAAKAEAKRIESNPNSNPTVRYLAKRYLEERVIQLRANTQESVRHHINGYVVPILGDLRVRDLDLNHVLKLKAQLSDKRTMANRVRGTLSAMLNWGRAVQCGLSEASPNVARKRKSSLEDYKEHPREFELPTPEEWSAFKRAIDKRGDSLSADALRLIYMTGCRLNEALGAKWTEFNLDDRNGKPVSWTLPAARAKQGKVRRFPLTHGPLLAMLKARRKATVGGEYLFPSRSVPNAPTVDIDHVWNEVRAEAGMERFRLHDLRHIFVSNAIKAGVPIKIIGDLVGHSSSWMTERYSHLFNDTAEAAAMAIGAALDGKPARAQRQAKRGRPVARVRAFGL